MATRNSQRWMDGKDLADGPYEAADRTVANPTEPDRQDMADTQMGRLGRTSENAAAGQSVAGNRRLKLAETIAEPGLRNKEGTA